MTEKKKRGITRECFLTLSSMIKNDYNTKLRKACIKAHNACIKERADTTEIVEGNVNRHGKRHYAFTDEFVRNVKIIDDAITGRSKIEKLRGSEVVSVSTKMVRKVISLFSTARLGLVKSDKSNLVFRDKLFSVRL